MSRLKSNQLSKYLFHPYSFPRIRNHIPPNTSFIHASLQSPHTKCNVKYLSFASYTKPIKRPSSSTSSSSSIDKQAESIQKAKELHDEVKILLANQTKRELEHSQKPWIAYFKHLFRTSRAELINIGAAFVCLMLALQIAGNRRLSKKIIQESQSLEQQVKELESIVLLLREKDNEDDDEKLSFLTHLSILCTDALIQQTNETNETMNQQQRFWSKWTNNHNKTQQQSDNNHNYNEKQRQMMIDTIQTILRREIQELLGYHGMSTKERNDRELEIVKGLMNERAKNNTNKVSLKNNNDFDGLDSLMGELQKASGNNGNDLLGTENVRLVKDESGDTKVKKTKFVM